MSGAVLKMKRKNKEEKNVSNNKSILFCVENLVIVMLSAFLTHEFHHFLLADVNVQVSECEMEVQQ